MAVDEAMVSAGLQRKEPEGRTDSNKFGSSKPNDWPPDLSKASYSAGR